VGPLASGQEREPQEEDWQTPDEGPRAGEVESGVGDSQAGLPVEAVSLEKMMSGKRQGVWGPRPPWGAPCSIPQEE
jgi:hypothetical protein